ncbi:MAG: hypothetical protein IT441_07535 [Phycisphaeraceae bacterium]|nr:hypothetical protein [Phycisphaeraceae bacterium]
MPVHVAILRLPYLNAILEGHKTVESRLTRGPLAPYRRVETGQTIYLKQSCGPVLGTAVAGRVMFFEELTPTGVRAIRRDYGGLIGGDDAYWKLKASSRYATLIWLTHVRPVTASTALPRIPRSQGVAWWVLPDLPRPRKRGEKADTLCVPITDGAIRNGYLRLPDRMLGGRQVERCRFILPGGERVDTRRHHSGLIQWRRWRDLYRRHEVLPGDSVRLTPLAEGDVPTYRVSFVTRGE